MNCPVCGSECIYVKETVQGVDGKIYRRRCCSDCYTKFRTVETVMEDRDDSHNGYFESIKNKSSVIRSYYERKEK